MKKLTLVVHTSLKQDLADYLRRSGMDSFIFSDVEEHSQHLEHDPFLSARDKVVGYVPQVRVEIILDDNQLEALLEKVKSTDGSFKGKGLYWVTDLVSGGAI